MHVIPAAGNLFRDSSGSVQYTVQSGVGRPIRRLGQQPLVASPRIDTGLFDEGAAEIKKYPVGSDVHPAFASSLTARDDCGFASVRLDAQYRS